MRDAGSWPTRSRRRGKHWCKNVEEALGPRSRLRTVMPDWLDGSGRRTMSGPVRAIIAPHAGFRWVSGAEVFETTAPPFAWITDLFSFECSILDVSCGNVSKAIRDHSCWSYMSLR